MRGTAPLVAANAQRSAESAELQVQAVEDALKIVGTFGASTKKLVAAGRLRLAHPTLSLAELAAKADPPMSKDALAGRLRRLIAKTGR
jgi:cell division protein WhiA